MPYDEQLDELDGPNAGCFNNFLIILTVILAIAGGIVWVIQYIRNGN